MAGAAEAGNGAGMAGGGPPADGLPSPLRGARATVWVAPPEAMSTASARTRARVLPAWMGWPSTKPCWAPPSMLSTAQPGRPSAPVTTA